MFFPVEDFWQYSCLFKKIIILKNGVSINGAPHGYYLFKENKMFKKYVPLVTVCMFMILAYPQLGLSNDEHAELTGPFATPMEVTKACLECHENASMEVMKTAHWNWDALQDVSGKGVVKRGKKNAFNNFCISIAGNWPRCTSCHVGYGWKDDSFDFSDSSRVDCLSCHDTTTTFNKPKGAPAGAGMPAGYTGNPKFDKNPVDLVKVAQSVGMPSRRNCLTCHANGGGGNNVKHGDIDMSLIMPDKEIDIHLAIDGQNFSCQECHTSEEHQIKGNAMTVSPGGQNSSVQCVDCHKDSLHEKAADGKILNKHIERVACQTCHIPDFARKYATKLSWDWSEAQNPANLPKEKRVIKKNGSPEYIAKKGRFVYGKNVKPVYAWFNGTAGAYHSGEKIDPAKVTKLAYPLGSKEDGKSKITPFKLHSGKQIYDAKNMYFLAPKLFPSGPDKAEAYWKSYDWGRAAKAAEKSTGLKYSGEYGFAPTALYDPINHMVTSSARALSCKECHAPKGRLDWKALGYMGDPKELKKVATQ